MIVLNFIIDRLDVAGLETGQVVTVIGRGRAYEISCLISKVRKRYKRKEKDFTLSLMLFVSDQSESDFSLWYINSYLNIRIRYWNKIKTIDSSYSFHKSKSIRLRQDFKAIPHSFRNCLELVSDIKANFKNSRELVNRIFFKRIFFIKYTRCLRDKESILALVSRCLK